MAARRTKRNVEEKLTVANIENVISLLEAEKPITKKDACAILNIAYNTARLGQIIDKHKEKKSRDAERRAALRGKPATDSEIVYIITSYVEGVTVEAISDTTHRGNTFIKAILDQNSVPVRARSHDYFKPELIPEGAVRTKFEVDEVVYSARYDCLAKIKTELYQNNEWVYRIWLIAEKWMQFAYQPAHELASVSHLKAIGVKF